MEYKKQLLAQIDSYRDDIIRFAQELVRTPSETPSGCEREVAELIESHMRELGVGPIEMHARNPKRPNLLGHVPLGDSGRRLILNAHTDTKDVGDRSQWSVDPFGAEIKDGFLYGRGAVDMKGALAAEVYAAVAIREIVPDLPGEILLMFVADEEGGGWDGTRFLIDDVGIRGDAAIIGEPSGIDASFDCLHIAHRGVLCFDVHVRGTQMHSSMSDVRPSVNASVKLAKVLLAFAREFRPSFTSHPLYPQGPTVNIGVRIEGGVFYGVYPGHAWFGSDIRLLPRMTKDTLARDLESFIATLRQRDPELDIELDMQPREWDWIPPMELSRDEPVVQAALAAATAVLGREPKISGMPGGTDAHSMYLDGGIPTIPALGPGRLELAHGPDERVPVEDIIIAAKIYALAALRFLRSSF